MTEKINGGAVCKDVRETNERFPDTQKVKAKAGAMGELVWFGSQIKTQIGLKYSLVLEHLLSRHRVDPWG